MPPINSPFSPARMSSIFSQPRPKRFQSGIIPPYVSRRMPEQSQPSPTFPSMGVGREQDDGSQKEPDNEGMRYFEELEQIRSKRGPALSAYQQHLQEMPTREEHKPGIGRRLLAAGAAGATAYSDPGRGMQVGQYIRDTPYNEAAENWSNKAKGLGESARLEQEEVDSQLSALTQARALGLKYDEFALKKLEGERQFGTDTRARDTADRIADLIAQRDKATDRRTRERLDAEIKHWSAQDTTGGENAKTGRMNAKTNARGQKATAAYQTGSVAARNRGVDAYIARGSGRNSRVTPDQQNDAMDNALRTLYQDPQWKDFVEETGDGYYKVKEGQINSSPMYQAFIRELKRRAGQSVEGGVGADYTGDIDDDDDSIIIGMPEP